MCLKLGLLHRGKNMLRVFKKRVPRKVFALKRDTGTGLQGIAE
jgi:hypothetical protein